MRFWDSSAIVPLLAIEGESTRVKNLLDVDEDMAIWWATPVECCAAIQRRLRDRSLSSTDAVAANQNLDLLAKHWNEIHPVEEVRRQARRLVRVHPLRTADALQLAAAIVWRGRSDWRDLVSLDDRLRVAAAAEGFTVLPA